MKQLLLLFLISFNFNNAFADMKDVNSEDPRLPEKFSELKWTKIFEIDGVIFGWNPIPSNHQAIYDNIRQFCKSLGDRVNVPTRRQIDAFVQANTVNGVYKSPFNIKDDGVIFVRGYIYPFWFEMSANPGFYRTAFRSYYNDFQSVPSTYDNATTVCTIDTSWFSMFSW